MNQRPVDRIAPPESQDIRVDLDDDWAALLAQCPPLPEGDPLLALPWQQRPVLLAY